ncbi:hypothetical protein [Streptomyces sp. NPDC088733]|uniref:hypothetical protein n=1 Tax=Streptomyces sp. NPDC088733 TaxID=3365880 RepID=UPI0037F174CE
METPYVPLPAEVFDAPPPLDVYADGPTLADLQARVEQLMDTTEWRENREYRLLNAVVADRRALLAPGETSAQQDAHTAAWLLREFDEDHRGGGWMGKHPPFAPEWEAAGGSRPYARQEYAAWLQTGQPGHLG